MMKIKNAIYLLFAVLVMVGCDNGAGSQKYSTDLINNPNTASGDTSKKQVPEITFDKKMHDFGRLSQGESIAYSFKFTNTGNADLVISNCDATCGCTVADFPKNRIKPGETGYITVSFNSAGKYGQEEQMIEVMANTQPSRTQLIVRALVEN